MTVDVELFGQLSSGKPRRQSVILEVPMTVGAVAVQMGLDPNEIGLVSIDGVLSDLHDMVPTECRLCFFPPMSGG